MLLAGLTAVDGWLVPERCVQNHLEAVLEPSWLYFGEPRRHQNQRSRQRQH
jgi:hypothetical protein